MLKAPLLLTYFEGTFCVYQKVPKPRIEKTTPSSAQGGQPFYHADSGLTFECTGKVYIFFVNGSHVLNPTRNYDGICPGPPMSIPKVRDNWLSYGQEGRSSGAAPVAVNYAQDTWNDANLDSVLVWLEDYLNDRQSKSSRTSIDSMG